MDKDALTKKILDVGEQIRAAKAAGTTKEALSPLLADLLAAKAAYKEATGEDYGPPPQSNRGSKKSKGGAAGAAAPDAKASGGAKATTEGKGGSGGKEGSGSGDDGKISKSEQKRLAKAALKADNKKKGAAPCDADLTKAPAGAAANAAPAGGAPAAAAPVAKEEFLVDFDEYRQIYQYSNWAVALANAPPPQPAAAAPAAASSTGAAFTLPSIGKAPPIPFNGGVVPYLSEVFLAGIRAAFPALNYQTKSSSIVTRSRHFADYQCNASMELFKLLKGEPSMSSAFKKPSDVGEAICAAVTALGHVGPVVASLSVAPQGFINVTLAQAALFQQVANLVSKGSVPPPASVTKKLKVAVDFSSPNIAKEMHVGHLRSTIIGDTICRILEFAGHEVHRLNHVGDWGTQFGMLILHLKETFPNFLQQPPNITDLTGFYRDAKGRFDADETFKKQAQLTVVKLQGGDKECTEVWKMLCDVSRKEFDKVYARLDVKTEERGESFYNSRIPKVVEALQKAENLATIDGGAVCIFLETIPFGCCGAGNSGAANVKRQAVSYPLFLRKGDGGYGYDSTDMAAIHHRLNEMSLDWVVYVTDKRQAEHFYMCFEAARRAQWLDDTKHRFEHVGFGMVCGEDGKPYKTRSGDTVRLVDLLDESAVRMRASLDERVAAGKSHLSPEALESAARVIGYGAVKYFDLKQHPETDYNFSFDAMLDTKGDTAVYLLFAYARFQSIVRKGAEEFGVDAQSLAAKGKTPLRGAGCGVPMEKEEVALALELLQLPDVLDLVLGDLMPHRLCGYLYDLCVKGTTFVTQCFVLDTKNKAVLESRLLLCAATCAMMKQCFSLLGIDTLDRI